eukprot:TRINITY_DN23682_c0_g1_i1.p1 TRINITY_DN23682_c0_g1~~TRINITY_DN23682_c0_g1_i1.p1  ORF type:complete len:177 (+),score=48.93 TRINITY_DN23682_c0_g1_i1:51-533(+)
MRALLPSVRRAAFGVRLPGPVQWRGVSDATDAAGGQTRAKVLRLVSSDVVVVSMERDGQQVEVQCKCEPKMLMGGPVAGAMLSVVGDGSGWRAVERLRQRAASRVAPKFAPRDHAGSDFASKVRTGWDWSSQQALRRVSSKGKRADLLPWSAKADMMRNK